MKRMMCKDLGGACDAMIEGRTSEEIGNNCTIHAKQMMELGDEAHLQAAEVMRKKTPAEFEEFMKGFYQRFEEAEEV